MGLHLNVPESQLSDQLLREHRNRVWWTAYELDRLLAVRLSQPFSIQDDEIQVDLPSNIGLSGNGQDDFADACHLVNRIKLVKLSGQVIRLLYGRKTENESFLQRVQQALKDLQDWLRKLEGDMHAEEQQTPKITGPMKSLLLSFNQVRLLITYHIKHFGH